MPLMDRRSLFLTPNESLKIRRSLHEISIDDQALVLIEETKENQSGSPTLWSIASVEKRSPIIELTHRSDLRRYQGLFKENHQIPIQQA